MRRQHQWSRIVDVPGSRPPRRVAITYQRLRHGPDEPERERRHGWLLLVTWPVFAGLSLFLALAWINEPAMGEIVGPFAILAGLYALGYLVNGATMRKRGASNLAGRRTYTGVVLDHYVGQAIDSEGDRYATYFLAVDEGKDQTFGWEVSRDRQIGFPVGAVARVVVSGDGQYLYDITTAQAPTAQT